MSAYKNEKKAEEMLKGKDGLEYFIPKHYAVRVYHGVKSKRLVPVIPNLVFVHASRKQITDFCQRKKIPLLFVSLKGMIDDIRFLNLLEESHVDFRCIDFPWFCKENLPLIKAVVLYEKLEIRINV